MGLAADSGRIVYKLRDLSRIFLMLHSTAAVLYVGVPLPQSLRADFPRDPSLLNVSAHSIQSGFSADSFRIFLLLKARL